MPNSVENVRRNECKWKFVEQKTCEEATAHTSSNLYLRNLRWTGGGIVVCADLIISHCLFQSLTMCVTAPVFNLVVVGGVKGHHHSQDGCDLKAQGDGDLLELSAADASNPDKAKSANSVSLILVYICLPVPVVQPYPHHHDRPW